ncbi:MAG: hypothetical protein IKX20_03470 [Paludibacteraceae bacterium]|nr:hypothetical protein [Paludibacteraceae bacterium]
MEQTLILLFAGLAVIFFVLWLAGSSRTDSYSKLTNELHGINDTMNRLVYKMPAPQEATEKQGAPVSVPEAEISKPVTIESVRSALRYNGISPEILDTHEPDIIKFTFNDRKYRLNLGRLPFVNIMLVFGIDKEDDADLMRDAAQYVSLRSYGASVFVIPEDGCFLISTDVYADSYLYLRNNIRFFLEVVENTGGYFYSRYEELREQKKKSSQDAINAALIAAQNDMTGKKVPS